MNFKELCAIKDAVDTFNDSSFVSVISENEVAVQNNKTNEIWKIEFSFSEDGKLSFNTENAVVLEAAQEEDLPVDSKQEIIKAFSHSLINEDAVGIEYVKEAILEADDLFGNRKIVNESSEQPSDQDLVMVFREDLDYSEEERQAIIDISSKWEEKIEQFQNIKKEFVEAGNLFNEDSTVKAEAINPLDLLDSLAVKKEQQAAFIENKSQLEAFTESVNKIFENEEICKAAMSGINVLDISDKSLETKLTKNLVVIKKDYNEDLNIRDLTKKIINTRKEIFGEALGETNKIIEPTGSWHNNNNKRFNYLKFQSGVFTRHDLNALMEDFDNILGNFLNMNRDDMLVIQEMKDTIDYMYRTNQIVDEIVFDVINRFNESFYSQGIPNGKQDYFNPEKSGADTAGLHLKAYHRSIAPGSV